MYFFYSQCMGICLPKVSWQTGNLLCLSILPCHREFWLDFIIVYLFIILFCLDSCMVSYIFHGFYDTWTWALRHKMDMKYSHGYGCTFFLQVKWCIWQVSMYSYLFCRILSRQCLMMHTLWECLSVLWVLFLSFILMPTLLSK